MPYPSEHAARVHEPMGYERFRRENDKFGPGISVIWGIKSDGTTDIQAIRFDKTKFTPDEAREWMRSHNHEYISFEEASNSQNELENEISVHQIGKVLKREINTGVCSYCGKRHR